MCKHRFRTKRKRWMGLSIVIGLLGVITVFVAESAYAVPAFARRYDVTCNECHT